MRHFSPQETDARPDDYERRMRYSTPCDVCGLAAGMEGLVSAGEWPNGTPKVAHRSCLDEQRS